MVEGQLPPQQGRLVGAVVQAALLLLPLLYASQDIGLRNAL